METKYLYLILNLFTLCLPLLLSFDKKVAYFRRWKYLLPSIGIVGAFFVIWDIFFTKLGVWGFNSNYLTGIELATLPVEEWIFFISVPYASIFIYDCIKAYFPEWKFSGAGVWIALFLALIFMLTGIFNITKWYTAVTFLLISYLLFYLGYKKVDYLGRFFLSYAIVLVPFLIVNGILTGSGIEEQVVWYNEAENLGIKIFTIPLEDTFYGMLLILGNVSLYEYLQFRTTDK